jgi:hypothetical protein
VQVRTRTCVQENANRAEKKGAEGVRRVRAGPIACKAKRRTATRHAHIGVGDCTRWRSDDGRPGVRLRSSILGSVSDKGRGVDGKSQAVDFETSCYVLLRLRRREDAAQCIKEVAPSRAAVCVLYQARNVVLASTAAAKCSPAAHPHQRTCRVLSLHCMVSPEILTNRRNCPIRAAGAIRTLPENGYKRC